MSEPLSDVMWFRAMCGLLLSIFLQILPVSFYLAINTFGWIWPWTWVWNIILSVFSPYIWFVSLPLYSVLMLYAIALTLELTKPIVPYRSRYQLWLSLLNGRNLLKLACYGSLGWLVPIIYFHIAGESMFYNCHHRTTLFCIDEEKLFVLCATLWVSVYYFYRYEWISGGISLGLVPQPIFQLVRAKIPELLRKSLSISLYAMIFAPVAYFFLKPIVTFILGLFVDFRIAEASLFGCFYHIMDAWLMSSVFLLATLLAKESILISLISRYKFSLDLNDNCNLVEGLKQKNALVRDLAFFDLFLTSSQSGERRSAIFGLSQPGGHPHLWKALLTEVISVLSDFSLNIEQLNDVESLQTTIPPKVMPRMPIGLRSLTQGVTRSTEPPSATALEQIQEKTNQFWKSFKQLPTIQYLFGDRPELRAEQLLEHSYPVLYGVEALADLAVVALREDRFGIVLNAFPSIINAIMGVRTSVETIGRFVVGTKKYQKKSRAGRMRDAIKSAVKRSLYKISQKYAIYLDDLPLDAGSKNVFQNFVNFKEC